MTGVWDLYHLRGNPFFQDPLGSDIVASPPPIDALFVGREEELAFAERLVTHDERTRVVISGAAGVGKTTFLNRLRERLERTRLPGRRFVTHTPALRIQGEWTAMNLCTEILRTVLVIRGARTPKKVPPKFLKQLSGIATVFGQAGTALSFWDHVAQVVEGRQLLGVGLQGGTALAQGGGSLQPAWAPPVIPPPSLLLLAMDAIRLLAEELDAELVFVLNNLENLSREDAKHAAGLFQDVRDLFLTDRSHWIVCGTTEVDALILRASVQVGGIFGTPLELKPLTEAEVADLLTRRYQVLARGASAVAPPIDPEVGAQLYGLFRGNLRHFLHLLQDAVLKGAGPGGARPMPLEHVIRLIGHENVRVMQARLGPTAWRYFSQTVLGNKPDAQIWASFRQVDAARRTGKKPPVIKPHMDDWIAAQYLIPDDGSGGSVPNGSRGEWMRLSGRAAVGFAALALDTGRSIEPLFEGLGPTA